MTTPMYECSRSLWAMEAGALASLQSSIAQNQERRLFAAALPPRQVRGAANTGAVALIPIMGVLTQRDSWLLQAFGGTSTQAVGRAVDQAVSDRGVHTIVLEIDSPGGEVYGTAELAQRVASARKVKPIITVANSLAASAAYWIGSQASEFVVTPSGEVGSIGVVAVHQELSRMLDEAGIATTVIRSARFKYEGNEFEPLTDAALAALQKRVDEGHGQFVGDVARGRGVSVGQAQSRFGQGRVLSARDAVAAGMADRIATIEVVLKQLTSTRGRDFAALAASTPDDRLRANAPSPALQARLRTLEEISGVSRRRSELEALTNH